MTPPLVTLPGNCRTASGVLCRFRVPGSGFHVPGSEFRVQGSDSEPGGAKPGAWNRTRNLEPEPGTRNLRLEVRLSAFGLRPGVPLALGP